MQSVKGVTCGCALFCDRGERTGGSPTTEEDEWVIDSTGDYGTLGGYKEHDVSVAVEESWEPMIAAGELSTKTAGGNSPRRPCR